VIFAINVGSMHILIFWFTQEMEIKLLERQQQLKSELVCASTVSMCSWDSQEEEEEGVGKEIETLAGSRCKTRDSYE